MSNAWNALGFAFGLIALAYALLSFVWYCKYVAKWQYLPDHRHPKSAIYDDDEFYRDLI